MVYTAQTTTFGTRSSLKKVMACLCAMLLLAWGNVWAADHTYTSNVSIGVGETVEYDNVTINPNVTVTVKGTMKVTGIFVNNGGTLTVEGGTLEIGGKLDNKVVASGETDQDWKPNGNSTEKYFTNSDYSGSGSSANNKSSYSSYDTRYRKTTQPQKAVTNQNTYIGNISIINGNLSVSGNMTNAGNVSVKTTDATSIARIAISGNFENTSTTLTLKTYTYTRDKITKEVRKSNTNWNPSNITSTEESYNPENPKATEETTQTVSSATITLDNGYLVVNGDVTLEDKTTINFNQTNTKLKGVVDGEQVAIEPTLLVRGNATIQDDAKIALQSKKAGSLIVAKTFTDNATSDNQYPWSFEYQEGEGENAIKIKVKTDNGFSFLYGKYTGKNFDDTEEIAGVSDVVKDLLEELENLHETEEWFEDNPRYKTRSMEEIIKGLEDSKISVNVLNFLVASLWNAYIEWQINYFEEHPIADYNDFKEQLDAKENELEKIIENFDIDVEAIAKSKIDNEINIVTSLLPITLNYFTAEQDGEDVVFEWQTSSEVNNDFFTIEYSIDGIHFKELLREDGNGTTSETNNYYVTASAEDFTGITYFRLKQTDFNGEYSYSSVISLMVEAEETNVYVYPNPAAEFVSVSGTYNSALVKDVFGKTVLQASNNEQIYVGNLSAGTYYVVITTANGKKVLPFVKK